ncbi:MAG: hypothetical protein KME45_08305 [Stenomitos rutilans HA7619-LM2]|jgi:hypothetical protein|nr:hypothetical protein [Stenomitos rutilans HA7619-LM2]
MSNVLLPSALRLNQTFHWSAKAIGTALLLLTVSCTQQRSSQVELSLNVEPSNRLGVFTVSGSTNVPDQSQIIVQGIRPLATASQAIAPAATPNYAILDRQTVIVSQGRWQATLKLWQSAPDGQYQEVWQANQRQLGPLQPSPEVVFLATIDPGNQSKVLKQQLERQGKTLEGPNVRFTTNEQWYLQAKQTLAVTPPTVKQSASALKVTDSDETLTLRSSSNTATSTLAQTNLPVIKENQSTAPLSVSQRFR